MLRKRTRTPICSCSLKLETGFTSPKLKNFVGVGLASFGGERSIVKLGILQVGLLKPAGIFQVAGLKTKETPLQVTVATALVEGRRR